MFTGHFTTFPISDYVYSVCKTEAIASIGRNKDEERIPCKWDG